MHLDAATSTPGTLSGSGTRTRSRMVLALTGIISACGGARAPCATCPSPSVVPTMPSSTAAGEPDDATSGMRTDLQARLKALRLSGDARPATDVTNRYADDVQAATLGKKLFHDTRFSGPLLDEANNGTSGTLGTRGQAGKVACVSCHTTDKASFVDLRSPRQQLSLGSGWTHRKAPSLLDTAQNQYFMWDGRRDSAFSQVFSPLESPLEFNSSRLFVAQQVARLYRKDYEALFGALPDLSRYPTLEPIHAGCDAYPPDPVAQTCEHPGDQDDAVVRVVVNFGKAIQAFTRTLSCGRSRFDAWLEGDESALSDSEKAGAMLFVGKADCVTCHTGPYLTDGQFHNVGVTGGLIPFTGVSTFDDPGAAPALTTLLKDPLNSRGRFSDGNDDRLDALPSDVQTLLGAFKTPSLRCVSRRASFMHNGEFRALGDAVDFFNDGGSATGFVGQSELMPRHLSREERDQLVAFLGALDGNGPETDALIKPELAP